ncbi:unnamed protein product [Orchesella dallaii]|uniref:CCHC-type domain-containing protein n=1 Tax=Orchesella dallaii TaxID=48710 RepID=A0ABP1RL70_9HEXA
MSKESKSRLFRKHTRKAEATYGVSTTRPQDLDPVQLRTSRRTNYNMIPEFPANYRGSLIDWCRELSSIQLHSLPEFSMNTVHVQDELNQTKDILEVIKTPPNCTGILAVDFEFHNTYSYDGFICVASVSSPTATLVVDCLLGNREFAKDWMSKMLTGKRTLKVFCGCANDIFRLQKDWSCFPFGILDLQDLFVIWRRGNLVDCTELCKSTVQKRLLERGQPILESAVIRYLTSLDMPGLAFLMEVFFPTSPVSKNTIASYADWRKRPLHPGLVHYSAIDSYFTLRIFFALYEKVGLSGVKEACERTIGKLLNRSELPRYPNNIVTTPELQWVVERLFDWRSYLAKNFDRKPQQVLSQENVPKLANELHRTSRTDVDIIAGLLRRYRVNDDFVKSARLLTAYLERDGTTLQKMRTVICHNCNKEGHVAKFCFFESVPEARKQFLERPENAEQRAKQQQRRHNNWCLNRGLNPATTICPWEPGYSDATPGVVRTGND